ncbi:DNA fragmentation factor subunit beta isoform X3 [Acyrthosiphon pisum]|uniref:CIDE-N domain-containing protein n=1 Tax=Acyrthosiphon pisum TaxID=7029 RepID=A0A8R1WYK4_ACYPI|nr:DNA fragmentation factor subunit beta isoform X3 [Acyrthosiphon pisum]
MKGYKITNCAQDMRFGIVGNSLKDVFTKGCQKLKLDHINATMMTVDGTVIDDEDYFQQLPAQTLFIFRLNGETFETGADLIYNVLAAVNNNTLKTSIKIKSFMDENIKEKIRILSSVLDVDDESKKKKISSLRLRDPDWFQGLETRARTKEEFMFKRCQERIRSYMYKTKSDMIKSDFYIKQTKCRKSNTNGLCDEIGTFKCEGAWNQSVCSYERGTGHKINPYQSRESRIIFSTWNLDHWVERSRTIIPALFEASKMASEVHRSINMNYFYELLFTTVNLKLVHIVCHDKGQHISAKCDPNLYLQYKKVIHSFSYADNCLENDFNN